MENASKALIIAGAILISILLISVGVLIMNSTGNTQQSVQENADTIAIRTFNSNFTPYEGEDQSASQIRSLISAVKSSNAKSEHQIELKGKTSGLKANKKYTVEIGYEGTDGGGTGYIQTITVTEQGTSK